mmetsp:Transcript_25845/g.63945  ORF Transcript_25845/g.63945 Transcript_25845/m.63945 type:complete len:94 (+) Transcript_25845:96-377(+)
MHRFVCIHSSRRAGKVLHRGSRLQLEATRCAKSQKMILEGHQLEPKEDSMFRRLPNCSFFVGFTEPSSIIFFNRAVSFVKKVSSAAALVMTLT